MHRTFVSIVMAAVLLPQIHAAAGNDLSKSQAEMEPGMMLMCQMMMKTEVSVYDPTSILVVEESLDLSAEQKQQLQALVEDVRQQSRQILTEEQQQILGQAPEEVMSSMEMHRRMGQMHGQMMGKHRMEGQGGMKGQGDGMMDKAGMMGGNGTCPMMQMMDRKDHGGEAGAD